jgi:hypothetical protein
VRCWLLGAARFGPCNPPKVPPNTLIVSRTLPARQRVGVVGLFIVTDEHPDESGTLTLKKTARLVKSDSVNLDEKTVTFDFWDGRELIVIAENVLIESLIVMAPS